ncbi:MAG: TIGR02450 family Trp-rich protein [Pseudomonadales bacterium]
MNQINPKKLLHSKWTRVLVENKEKHFIVSGVEFDEAGEVIECIIEAVINNRQQLIDWQSLKDSSLWRQNWQ